jgi:hypothetical protein
VPLLVCRSAHDRLFWMAKDLGFLVKQTGLQYMTLPKSMTEKYVQELRDELGLTSLTIDRPANPNHIIELFTNTIPQQAAATASRWAESAPGF